jgi:hypothetical protein
MANQRASGRGIGSELEFAESSVRASLDLTRTSLPGTSGRFCHLTGPLLARPAGANVLLLAKVFPVTASPVDLSNRKGISNLKARAHVGQADMGRGAKTTA